jgi:hypothetical protein
VKTRYAYLVAEFFAAYALLLLAFRLHLVVDFQSPQRAAALGLVTYFTLMAIYLLAAAVLVVARRCRWVYVAGFAASLPPIYQLWVNLLQPVLSSHVAINYLGTLLYLFLLVLLPMGARCEVQAARLR